MENKNFTQKQIANWRRIAMNVNSDVIKRDKLQTKIMELTEELKSLDEIIEMQEYPVKMATGGYTTSDIFVKNVVTTDKVDANGRALKKTTYDLRWPESVLPPVMDTKDDVPNMPIEELHTNMNNTDII